MSETLKNRPDLLEPNRSWDNVEKWFKGFESKMVSFRVSRCRCIDWLQKYTMIDPLDDMKLMQVQAVLRTFIEKEILGK